MRGIDVNLEKSNLTYRPLAGDVKERNFELELTFRRLLRVIAKQRKNSIRLEPFSALEEG